MIKVLSFFVSIFLAGCAETKDLYSRPYVDEYRDLIGKSLSEVQTIFGSENVEVYSLPGHELESALPAFEITHGGKVFSITGHDNVDSVIFQDSMFKTKRGIQISQGYCEVVGVHSEADFYFGFEDGGTLQLRLRAEKTVLSFDTSNLPLGQYVIKGLPLRGDRSLCSSRLTRIELHK